MKLLHYLGAWGLHFLYALLSLWSGSVGWVKDRPKYNHNILTPYQVDKP